MWNLINVSSKIKTPISNNEPNYGVATPDQFLSYYGDNKIKSQCDFKYLNVIISVKGRPLLFN